MSFGFNFGYGFINGASSGLRIGINQTSAGQCDINVASPCTATSSHQVVPYNAEGTLTYNWSVPAEITIVSGQGTDTVTVSSSGQIDTTFVLTADVIDSIVGSTSRKAGVTHDRIPAFNFVSNGTFDTDLTGWTATNGTQQWVNSELELTGSTITYVRSAQPMGIQPIVTGRVYTLDFDYTFTGSVKIYSAFSVVNDAPVYDRNGHATFELVGEADTDVAIGWEGGADIGDIMTIDNVVLSEKEPAILINGSFDTNANGWTGLIWNGDGTVSTGEGGSAFGYQSFTTVIGSTYRAYIDADNQGANPTFKAADGDGSGGTTLGTVSTVGTGMNSYTVDFTATSTLTSVVIDNGSKTALWDNAMVKRTS